MDQRLREHAFATDAGRADTSFEELMCQVANGSAESFAMLYDRTASRIFGLCRRVLRNDSDAEEVTQEVFLEVWRRAARFDPVKGSALNWILMVAHSRAIDRVRLAEAVRIRDDAHNRRSTEREIDSVMESILQTDDACRVRTALAGLSDIRREALTLAFLTDHTYREASDLLQVPVPTFKSRVRDALLAIRPALT